MSFVVQDFCFSLVLLFSFDRSARACTFSAAVTIAALDSALPSGSEWRFAKNFQPKFSTQQKILC
jgi:hypothetical protein